VTRVDIGGQRLTEFLGDLLAERGFLFSSTHANLEQLREIKEKLCYVALDFEQETNRDPNFMSRSIELNGQTICLSSERFRCPEALFQPKLLGLDTAGIHEQVINAIMKCDPDLIPNLFRNIVVSGGTSLFPGLPERLQKEIKARAAPSAKVTIIAPPGRQYAAWIGGSVVASLRNREGLWISRGDFDEFGPSVVHRRCF